MSSEVPKLLESFLFPSFYLHLYSPVQWDSAELRMHLCNFPSLLFLLFIVSPFYFVLRLCFWFHCSLVFFDLVKPEPFV